MGEPGAGAAVTAGCVETFAFVGAFAASAFAGVGDFAATGFAATGFAAGAFAAGAFAGAADLVAGVGHFADGSGVGFAAGCSLRGARAGAVFADEAGFAPAPERDGAFAGGADFFATTDFFADAVPFFAASLPLGAALRDSGLAAGRAREVFAAGFFAVLVTAGFFTGSPRDSTANLAREARHEGGAVFGRRGL